MQTTFKLFASCLFCLSLIFWTGCGNSDRTTTNATATQTASVFTPADEQTEVERFLRDYGKDAIIRYMDNEFQRENFDGRLNLGYIQFFVARGADVNARAEDEWGSTTTPLTLAMLACENDEIVKLLVSNGADVNAEDDKWGQTPLHFAATTQEDIEVVKFLISNGADVNAGRERGNTPLDMVLAKRRAGNQHPALAAMIEYLTGLE